jgi:hypothetical protein
MHRPLLFLAQFLSCICIITIFIVHFSVISIWQILSSSVRLYIYSYIMYTDRWLLLYWHRLSRPLLSSKRRRHLKTRESQERTKIWSWVPTVRETKNDYAGEDQQQFTGLNIGSQWLRLPLWNRPNREGDSHLRPETDAVSETLLSRIPEDAQSPKDQ